MPISPTRPFEVVFALASLVIFATAAVGQQPGSVQSNADLERRVNELEEMVRKLQANPGRLSPSENLTQTTANQDSSSSGTAMNGPVFPEVSPNEGNEPALRSGGEPNKPSALAGWNDGFYLQSPDRDFMLRVTGQIQGDYRDYLHDRDRTDVDSFLVRRARLGVEADMLKYYEFRLLPDFGQGTSKIQDAYMNVHYWDALQFEVGKFKQPFSYEQLIQDRFVPTVERSIIDQIVPARDVGVMIHGQRLFEDRLDYAIAVSDGEINGDGDVNKQKDVNTRVVARPFNSPDIMPFLHGLQVGVSAGYGIEKEPVNPLILRTPAQVPWFAYNSTVRADGLRYRISPEISYFCGPLGFAAQYIRQEQRLRPSLVAPGYPFAQDVPAEGFYGLATLLLTGETRTGYSQAIDPIHPFNPCCPLSGTGAWELVARVSRLEAGDSAFIAGNGRLADPTKYSSSATEMTLGFNWYFNKWVRMQFNYEHAWFDQPVLLGFAPPVGRLSDSDAIITRLQIIF